MSNLVIINQMQPKLLPVCHRDQYLDRNSSLLYINDIIKFSTLFHTILYADDTTLVGTFRDFELCNGHSLSENINYEITKLKIG